MYSRINHSSNNSLGSNNSSWDNLGYLVDKLEKAKIEDGEEEEKIKVESPEKCIKKPLKHAWTLWFFQQNHIGNPTTTWMRKQKPILTVTTVEDFWSLYNSLQTPSTLPAGSDYSIFKEGIFPDWEDPKNQHGGRWIISTSKDLKKHFIDTYWLELILMLFLIGEHADKDANQINGAAVSVRARNCKMAVWLTDASQGESTQRIGRMLKERLDNPSLTTVFSVHNEERGWIHPELSSSMRRKEKSKKSQIQKPPRSPLAEVQNVNDPSSNWRCPRPKRNF